jgi:hypothetical protein
VGGNAPRDDAPRDDKWEEMLVGMTSGRKCRSG